METLCDRLASFKQQVGKMSASDLKKEHDRLSHDVGYAVSGFEECYLSEDTHEIELYEKYYAIDKAFNKYLQDKMKIVSDEIIKRFVDN